VPGPIAATVALASARASRPCRHRLEQQRDPVRAGQADERVGDALDRRAHLVAVDPRLDPDRRQLDDLAPSPRSRAARPLACGAGRVTTTFAVQRPALEPGEPLAPAAHRADDDQRRRRSRPRSTAPAISPAWRDTVRCPASVPARRPPPARSGRARGDQRRAIRGSA
jgi:hypothetical protein